ncbi:hypothetical protein A4G20_05215 [Pasteurellaceae bacterium RH1A]|nr:hypothetical protein A4G20_05215 [Pasteurellaceae bacterium RH1A]
MASLGLLFDLFIPHPNGDETMVAKTKEITVKKSAIFPWQAAYSSVNQPVEYFKHTIEALSDKSIRITPHSQLEALRLLAAYAYYRNEEGRYEHIKYENDWTESQFATALIDFVQKYDPDNVNISDEKKSAVYIYRNEEDNAFKHTIELFNDGSVQVTPENSLAILLLCIEHWNERSNEASFKRDKTWKPEQLGAKFIDQLNKSKNKASWNWWLSLSTDLKYLLIYNVHEHLARYASDEDKQELLDIYRNSKRLDDVYGLCQFASTDYIFELKKLNIMHPISYEEYMEKVPFNNNIDLAPLATLKKLKSVFINADILACTKIPKGLDKLERLTEITISTLSSKTDFNYTITQEELDEGIKTLFEIANSLAKLNVIELSRSPWGVYLYGNLIVRRELRNLANVKYI